MSDDVTLTPHSARQIVREFPEALGGEILEAVLRMKFEKEEMRWKSQAANPYSNKLRFESADYLKHLRAEYYEDIMKTNGQLADPRALECLVNNLFEYEASSPAVDDSNPTPISWNASSMCAEQTARNSIYWPLSDKDFYFLRYIRVSPSSRSGTAGSMVYARSDTNTQTYKLVGSLFEINENHILSILSNVKTDKGTLLEDLEDEYREYVHEIHAERPHRFHMCILGMIKIGNVYGALQFRDYIKFAIKYLNHSRLRLKAEPVTLATDKKTPTFFYFNKKKLRKGPHQAWTDWMLVIPEEFRNVFMAWIYSVFMPDNKGRQALWLHSPGYDGKSQMINAISEYMNDVGVGAVNSQSIKNNFAYAQAYGKALIIFPDCQNEHFMHHSFTHTILGGDRSPVEFKRKDVFTAKLESKFLIGSNKSPVIDVNAMHELTRLIYIPLQKPPKRIQKLFYATDDKGNILYDRIGNPHPIGYKGTKKQPELKDALLADMSAFLFTCQGHYEKLCPNNKEIHTGDIVREALYLTCMSQESEIYEQHIDKHYEFVKNPKKYVTIDQIRANIAKQLNRDDMKWFKSYKESELLLSFKRIGERKLRQQGHSLRQYEAVWRDEKRCFTNVILRKKKAGGGKI